MLTCGICRVYTHVYISTNGPYFETKIRSETFKACNYVDWQSHTFCGNKFYWSSFPLAHMVDRKYFMPLISMQSAKMLKLCTPKFSILQSFFELSTCTAIVIIFIYFHIYL